MTAALAVACSSSSSSSGGTDSGTPRDAVAGETGSADSGATSACGHPGDKGNSLGVGQYCTSQDCPSTAPVCSVLNNTSEPANMQTFFCVLPCTACSPAGFCGDGASCVCSSAGCGCIPDSCSALIPDAGNPPCDAGASDAGKGD